MEKIEIAVTSYYLRPWYFPFMPQGIFRLLEWGYLNHKDTVKVSKVEYDLMMRNYFKFNAN